MRLWLPLAVEVVHIEERYVRFSNVTMSPLEGFLDKQYLLCLPHSIVFNGLLVILVALLCVAAICYWEPILFEEFLLLYDYGWYDILCFYLDIQSDQGSCTYDWRASKARTSRWDATKRFFCQPLLLVVGGLGLQVLHDQLPPVNGESTYGHVLAWEFLFVLEAFALCVTILPALLPSQPLILFLAISFLKARFRCYLFFRDITESYLQLGFLCCLFFQELTKCLLGFPKGCYLFFQDLARPSLEFLANIGMLFHAMAAHYKHEIIQRMCEHGRPMIRVFLYFKKFFRPLQRCLRALLPSDGHSLDPSTFSDCKEYHELLLEAQRHLRDLLPEIDVSEKLLLAPRRYQSLLEDVKDQFKRQLLCLGYDDDKIEILCEWLNQVLAEAQKLLALMWLLETLLHLFTLVITVCFSEFPNNLRPPCTTMPWIIVPALFVLWGVCWMFYDEFSVSSPEKTNTNTFQGETIYSSDVLPHANLRCR